MHQAVGDFGGLASGPGIGRLDQIIAGAPWDGRSSRDGTNKYGDALNVLLKRKVAEAFWNSTRARQSGTYSAFKFVRIIRIDKNSQFAIEQRFSAAIRFAA